MNAAPQILTYRKDYASHLYLPFEAELDAIGGIEEFMPFAWELFNGTIAAQQAGRGRVSTPEECYVTHLVGSASQGAGTFAVRLYDTERQSLLEEVPIIGASNFGTAQRPMWLKKLYRLPPKGQLQSLVQNLSALANAIQLVLWGLRRDFRGGA